ncbi:MAG: type II secretion system protein [Campylobacterota bacterium]|nr:type II secretion system protein [Campylobacterota bacterium]
MVKIPKMTYQTLRPAVAMIELIFALVIMGIVLMSAPMLVSTAMKSGYTSTQQELIAATSTHMSMVLSRKWDENNTLGLQKSRVLRTTTGAGLGLGSLPGTSFRAGTPTIGPHRTFIDHVSTNSNASAIVPDGALDNLNPFDDIDDYHRNTVNLIAGGGAATGTNNAKNDYIDTNIPITTTVQYIDATPSIEGNYSTASAGLNYNDPLNTIITAGTSDIKSVQVRLIRNNPKSPELDANITLNAFSCNIGSFKLDSRSL